MNDFRSLAKVKYKSKFNFKLKKKTSQTKYKSKFSSDFFWKKKNPIFMCPCCSTREDLSIDVSITIVGLILTKLRWFQLIVTSQNSNFELFWKKILGFPCCSTREDFSIDVSITIVGLILTKLWWFQLIVTSQNSNFELFWKKTNQIFEFPCCSTREDLSIDASITNVRLIMTKLWWFQLFSTSQNSNSNFFEKKIKFLGSHAVVLVKTFYIDVLITNVELILTKLRWFQLFVKSQISNFELFWRKKSNFWVSMV